MYEEFVKIIDEQAQQLNDLSDAVWDNPETAFSETKSVEVMTDYLKKAGFEVECPAYGIDTAFTATFGSGKPVIGLLGEFDALSGLSQVCDSFEKEPLVKGESGHGCGHNLLGVGSIAGALAVKKYLEETGSKGTVIYYGCPGEEGGSGKAFMAREGAFDNLDVALTWHPSEINNIWRMSSLANIQVLYKFTGISAHAAGNPEDGRSALDAVELMNIGVNFLREHTIDAARIHYAIVNSGGFSPNVVQPYAEVLYLIRAPKISQTQELFARVNKIAEGMAMATETTMEYEIIKSCANVVPNRTLEKELYSSMLEVELPVYTDEEIEYAKKITATSNQPLGKILDKQKEFYNDPEILAFLDSKKESNMYDFVIPYEETLSPVSMSGSTDVGDVSWQCPTAQIQTATWAPNSGGHSWQIVSQGKSDIAHKGTLYCGKILGLTAIKLLNQPETIAAAKAEFEETLKGQSYVPLPDDVKPRSIDSIGK